jgi:hypothetical protein
LMQLPTITYVMRPAYKLGKPGRDFGNYGRTGVTVPPHSARPGGR